jgi:transaldolase
VASFFVSRVDAAVDAEVDANSPLRGRIAIANAQRAYVRYLESLESSRWKFLQANGAGPQRPLWASTATKDAAYSDVRYVQELIAPGVINTMPPETLRAFAAHGDVGASLGRDGADANQLLGDLERSGVDLGGITGELETHGVESFRDSYRQLLSCIKGRLGQLENGGRSHERSPASPARSTPFTPSTSDGGRR